MKIENCEAVIFDLDGTLYNKKRIALNMMIKLWKTIPVLQKANRARKEFKGRDFHTGEEFHHSFYANIAEDHVLPEKSVEIWYQKTFYPVFINTLKRKYKARKDINKFLKELSEKMPLAVLSDYAFVKERLRALDISDEIFTVIASSEEFGVLKPSSRPLLNMAEELGVSPKKVLVVGDRADTDGEAAQLAGMMFYQISESRSWIDFCAEMLNYIKLRGNNG